MSHLSQLAREALNGRRWDGRLEHLWIRASLESLASGELVEVDARALRALTAPARVWSGMPAWPREAQWSFIGAMLATHWFAIARGDRPWLSELEACWSGAPEDAGGERSVRALGEIGLALAPGGSRPDGWSDDELEWLAREEFLGTDAPDDVAWLSIAQGRLDAAREALQHYEASLVDRVLGWERAPEEGVRDAMAHPEMILRTQARALQTLIEARSAAG